MAQSKLILFDIDGTILRVSRPGARAFDRVFREMFAVEQAWGSTKAHGKTDPLLIEEIAERVLGRRLSQEEYAAVQQGYLDYFVEEIERADVFEVLPGVSSLVEDLSKRSDICLGIQTGNFEASGRMKLKRARLDKFFPFGGFGSDSPQRAEIVRHAIARAERFSKYSFKQEDIVLIGDAPQDMQAGRANGISSIAVCTGRSAKPDLISAGANLCLKNLREKSQLFQFLGLSLLEFETRD